MYFCPYQFLHVHIHTYGTNRLTTDAPKFSSNEVSAMAVTTSTMASNGSTGVDGGDTASTTSSSASMPLRGAHRSKAIEEARAHLLKAERATKPSVTRWKAKLSTAGDQYCQAVILFYKAGEVEASKTYLLKACDCFKKKRSWYSAAKTLEQAMAITHKQGDLVTMSELAWRSAALFR